MNPLRRFARDFADALFPPQRFVVCDPALARLSDALAVRSDFAAVGRALSAATRQVTGWEGIEHDEEWQREQQEWLELMANASAEALEQYEHDREALRDLREGKG